LALVVDSHCHFHLLEEHAAPDEAVGAAREAGVDYFLNVAVDVESRDELLSFSDRHTEVFTCLGVHPSGAGHDPDEDELVRLAADNRFVAVGETGLDYVSDSGDLTWQRERFRRHIRAARALRKPIIVHSRGAPGDTVRILTEEGADDVGGVIHCFVEDEHTGRACVDLGFYLSLSGILTFQKAALRETVAALPLDRLLIETDAPYLAPVPYRGQENHPAWVRRVAECLANTKSIDFQDVAETTSRNFFDLFPLARPSQSAAADLGTSSASS